MQAAVSLNFTSLHEAAALRPWGAHNDYCGKLHSGRLRTDPKHLAVPGTKSAPQMHLVKKTSFAPVSHIASGRPFQFLIDISILQQTQAD